MPTTKVVILNWNGREYLEKFLPEVIAATGPGIGIVVADNGSDDGSRELLASAFPSVRVIGLDRNYGYAGGYDLALEQVEADYFILLNSDVRPSPGWCGPLVKALEEDEKLFAVQPKILSFAEPGRFEYAGASGGFIDMLGYPFCRGRILSTVEYDLGQYDVPRDVFWASGACMACRASVFRELGGFDADFFAHMEEIDLCWRAQLAGYRNAVRPESVVWHVGGGTLPNNSPRKIYFNFRNNLAMLYKNLSRWRFRAVLPFRMVLDGASAAVFLMQGNGSFFRAVLRAHRDFYRWRGKLRHERTAIQSSAVARPSGYYKGSVLLRYFFGKRRFGNML